MWLVLLFFPLAATAGTPGLPLRELSYRVDVSGPVAEIIVEQTFHAEGDAAIEATYTFPLQADAAVDGMRIEVGDRVIEGEIHDREEARQIYEEAVSTGHLAALTEQHRPNVFSQRVGNITPGTDVRVELRVLAPVLRKDGAWELVIPLVVAPRFVPEGLADAAVLEQTYGSDNGVDVDIDVALHAGLVLRRLESPSHPVAVVLDGAEGHARVDDVRPSADFVLRWWTATDEPQVGMLVSGPHALLTFEPPVLSDYGDRVPRELIFVVDQSGSMSGRPIDMARDAMRAALDQLDRRDSFQVVSFSNELRNLRRHSRAATPHHVRAARRYVRRMHANGGTYMLSAVSEVLNSPVDPGRHRVVVLLTDGEIGNDDAVLSAIAAHPEATVSTIGIGSSPNRYLLDEVARLGGGVPAYVTMAEDPKAAMDRMLAAMDRPVLTEARIDWGDWGATSMFPSRLPDLRTGAPIIVSARVNPEGSGPVRVMGRVGNGTFTQVIQPQRVARERALATTWARQRVADIHRRKLHGEIKDEKAEILKTGLEYHILTDYTAFVAVEWDRVANPGGRPKAVDQNLQVPDGQQVGGGNKNKRLIKTSQSAGSTQLSKEFLERVPTGRSYQDVVAVEAGTIGYAGTPTRPSRAPIAPDEQRVYGTNSWDAEAETRASATRGTATEDLGLGLDAALSGPIVRDGLWFSVHAGRDELRTEAIDVHASTADATLSGMIGLRHRILGAFHADPMTAATEDAETRYGGPSASLRWQAFPRPQIMVDSWVDGGQTQVAGDSRRRLGGASQIRLAEIPDPWGTHHSPSAGIQLDGRDWRDGGTRDAVGTVAVFLDERWSPAERLNLSAGWRGARRHDDETQWLHSPYLALDLQLGQQPENRLLAGISRDHDANRLVEPTRADLVYLEWHQAIHDAWHLSAAARLAHDQLPFAPPPELSDLATQRAAPTLDSRTAQTALTVAADFGAGPSASLTWWWTHNFDGQDAELALPVAFWVPGLLDSHRAHQLQGRADWHLPVGATDLRLSLDGRWASAIAGPTEAWWLEPSTQLGAQAEDSVEIGRFELHLGAAATRAVNDTASALLPLPLLALEPDASEVGDLPPWRFEGWARLTF